MDSSPTSLRICIGSHLEARSFKLAWLITYALLLKFESLEAATIQSDPIRTYGSIHQSSRQGLSPLHPQRLFIASLHAI